METESQARIAEIRKRVQEYRKHEYDSYVYHREEIDAVRKLKAHAPKDLEFLLALLDRESGA